MCGLAGSVADPSRNRQCAVRRVEDFTAAVGLLILEGVVGGLVADQVDQDRRGDVDRAVRAADEADHQANAKPWSPSPPKMYRITTTSHAVNDVRIVRLRVWLIASLTIFVGQCGVFPLISRIRSKITIVSLTEKPIR